MHNGEQGGLYLSKMTVSSHFQGQWLTGNLDLQPAGLGESCQVAEWLKYKALDRPILCELATPELQRIPMVVSVRMKIHCFLGIP